MKSAHRTLAVYIRRGQSNSDNIKFGQAFHGVLWILGKYWTPGLATFQNIPEVAGEALYMTHKYFRLMLTVDANHG